MSPPKPADLPSYYASLAPIPSQILALLAVAGPQGLTATMLASGCRDQRMPGQRALASAQVNQLLQPLLAEGIVRQDIRWSMEPVAAEALRRLLLHQHRYSALGDRVGELDPLPPCAYGYDRAGIDHLERELRLAIYRGDDLAFKVLRQRASTILLYPMVTEPLEEQLIRQAPPGIQLALFESLRFALTITLHPLPPLRNMLEEACARSGTARLWILLAELALLQGDAAAAVQALERGDSAAGGGDPSLAEVRGLIQLATGDLRGAEKSFAAWLAAERAAQHRKDLLPFTLPGGFLPLAFVLGGTQARRKQAQRLIDLACAQGWKGLSAPHAGWPSLRPLTDPGSTVVPAPPPISKHHPLPVLLETLAASWTGAELPEPARRAEAVTRARTCGLHWLADELEIAAGASLPERPGLVSLRSHREQREAWELTLDAMEVLAPAPRAPVRSAPEGKRLAWDLVPHGPYLSLRHQSATRQGWSEGRPVAEARIASGLRDVDGATDADRRIAAYLSARTVRGWSGYPETSYTWNPRVWTALVDHPAVFDADSGAPVTVVQVQPRLQLEASPAGTRLSVSPAPTASVVVTPVGAHGYEIVVFSKEQLALASLVGKGLQVPPQGHSRLAALLERLSTTLPLSDRSSATPAETDADSRILVRLSRAGEGLACSLGVRPAGDEGPVLAAGHGAELILVACKAGPRRLRRKLALERDNHAAVHGRLPALAEAEWTGEAWILPGLEQALDLLGQLDTLRDLVTLEWQQGDPLRLRQPRKGGLKIDIREVEGWFEARGNLAVAEGEVIELAALLERLGSRQGRFLRLGEGEFLELSADFVRRLEELRSAGRVHRGGIQVHPLAAATLSPLAEEAGTLSAADSWRERLRTLELPVPEAPLPLGLEAELRPYQQDGYRWLQRMAAWGAGACLADDMGLGKTVQTLALLLSRAERGPALVVAPTSVCAGWREQCWRFAPDLVIHDLRDGDRERLLSTVEAGDIVVCSYGLLVTEQKRLACLRWATLVLDESQSIKNPQTQRHEAALAIPAEFRLALTGTPVENRLDELWAQMAVLNPGFLGTRSHFRDRFARPVAEGDREALRQLKRLVRPVILRRTKAEVLDELPEKTVIDVPVELEGEEAATYEALRREAALAAESSSAEGSGPESRFALLAWLTRLRLCACHPRLAVEDAPTQISAKLRALGDIVESLRDNHHRALVFSQFTRHLDLVEAFLAQRGIPIQRLDGSTPPAERERRVHAFQAGEGMVFLISLRAGGFGLNLTAADYVIHLDPWWNPAVESQASDRAHRIGQVRPVTVYRLFAQGTVEERILALQHDKRALAEALMEGSEGAAALSVEELREILLGEG